MDVNVEEDEDVDLQTSECNQSKVNDENKSESELPGPEGNISLLGKKNAPQFELNSVLALDALKEVDFNWFSFVTMLQPKFAAHGYTDEVLNQFLIDFSSQLPHLGLKEDELELTELSRIICVDELQTREVEGKRLFDISDSESDEDDQYTQENKEAITEQLRRISDKWRKKTKKEIASERIMRKKYPKMLKVSSQNFQT